MSPWSPVLTLLGVMLVLLISYDLLKTVLTVSGGGPVTARLNARVWGLALRLATSGERPSPWLRAVGPGFAVLTLLTWLVGLWIGWTLIFSGSAEALVRSTSGAPAGLVDRVYYAGYTLTTLGPGDYAPRGALWEIATVLAAVNGLFLFTMAITYIVPVIAAAAQQRQLATLIDGLGDNPADLLVRAWHEGRFDALEGHLSSLAPMIAAVRQQHLAYPILHYFHAGSPGMSLPVQMAVLDETLLLLADAVERDVRPAEQTIRPLRAQLDGYLETLESAWIEPIHPPPPPPDLGHCAAAGIPTLDEAALRDASAAQEPRRATLHGLVQSDGWRWSDVNGVAVD